MKHCNWHQYFMWIWILIMASAVFMIQPSTICAKETIKYIGSSTVGKFITEASETYLGAEFSINTAPESGGGETSTLYGKADIGGVAREVRPEILEKGVTKILIGKDAIGVWVNADNPVNSLSIDQLKAIFTGKITNWKEVGGPNLMIHVYIVNPQSATRKVFQQAVMGDAAYAGSAIQTVRPDPSVLDRVKADKSGIGQLSIALGVNHPVIEKVKTIAVDGHTASVHNPGYPITRPLYLITKGIPSGQVKAFIDWALSDAGQVIVKKYFVGIKK